MEVWYIEDDADVADFVSHALRESGFSVRVFSKCIKVRGLLGKTSPNVLLADWNLPDGSGPSLCKQVRRIYPDLPIILITVRDDPNDIVAGLEAGADDYLTKPFDSRVLVSRIRALLRRTDNGPSILTCGKITLDEKQALVLIEDEPTTLSASEYSLLTLLMRNKGRIVTRDAIREELWGKTNIFINDNSLTVAMKRLRSKLGAANYIKTVRSFGYRLEEPL
ncbi:response regulator transcription factor [Adlercreutzia sp. R21]|uniref:response regulator transcription factor n=1 Tax=Adlercreutzia wanghongyangiae TaxID=3111451 RepID=UPI002DC0103F|nr:response regulator transcription factor [Adlercreutzia sp. R21]MEC4184026.1 response regulator transcription factor [Adlercreutzia sp. R21]